MRCVVFTGVGGREVVTVTDRPDPEPAKFELLIEPGFSGVNPADALQREGRHPVPAGSPTDVPGLEVAGTVVTTGPDVTAFSVATPPGWSRTSASWPGCRTRWTTPRRPRLPRRS